MCYGNVNPIMYFEKKIQNIKSKNIFKKNICSGNTNLGIYSEKEILKVFFYLHFFSLRLFLSF